MADDSDEQQQYVDDLAARRGYVLPYHKAMAANDLPVMKAADALVAAAYLDQRSLDSGTKELLFVLSLTVLKAEPHHIASHIRVALSHGVTPQQILEAIEIALPEAGVVAFQHGFNVWCDVVGAQRLEPSPGVLPPSRSSELTRQGEASGNGR